MRISVTITTHNRLEELKRTVKALAMLDPQPDEIWICADGCSDGTDEWLGTQSPTVNFVTHPTPLGSVPSRNELAGLSTGDLLLSLDDDSYPVESDFIERLRELFAESPRLAVATFPQRSDEFPESLTAPSFGATAYTASYVNSGAAIRKNVFEALGGYPGFFFHAYEEPDFALRCVAAGWQVRYETTLSIRHHYTGTGRNELRTHSRHSRNELWSVLLRCPFPQLVMISIFRIVRQLSFAFAHGGIQWVLREPGWWLACLQGLPRCLRNRQALPWTKYWRWMQLMRRPVESEAEWTSLFVR